MNWLFGGGGTSSSSSRPEHVQAVTGVSSDYYAHQDHLPVAVAVPMGMGAERDRDGPGAAPYAAASVAPLPPPPANPAYKSTAESSQARAPAGLKAPTAQTGANETVSSVTPSAPPYLENSTVNGSISHQNSAPVATPQRQQPPASPAGTRMISPISFASPPTIIPANNTVVMPLVAAPGPTAQRGPMAAIARGKQGGARQFDPLPLEFGRRSAFLSCCPYCQSLNVRSRLRTFPGWKTWVAVALIALVFWPLAWVPLVVDCTKTTEHYCPNCHALVGSVDAFEDACVKRRN